MEGDLLREQSAQEPDESPSFPRARHVTHEHLLGAIVAELSTRPRPATLRILDAGCGEASFVQYLHESIPLLLPDWPFEVYGFDVGDHGVQEEGFLESALQRLASDHPHVDWQSRIRPTSVTEPWPFGDGQFEAVVSNQVCEHVSDLEHFFAENARVLSPGGFGLHLFPLRSSILEGHVLIPFAHRIRDHDLSRWFLARLTNLGVGKFRQHARQPLPVEQIAISHADYLHFFTSYHSWRDVVNAAKACGLRASYRYTADLYVRKWNSLRGRPLQRAANRRHPVSESLAFHVLKYVSGVTLLLTKEQRYRDPRPA
ncbi:MAG: class I SAM-dependent methyltransferase [Actinomycetota bacterium]